MNVTKNAYNFCAAFEKNHKLQITLFDVESHSQIEKNL
jgi:hypothetical protein